MRSPLCQSLEQIRAELGDCRRCKLAPPHEHRVRRGNPRAALVFVGEAPGADEDEQGLPSLEGRGSS